MDVTKTIAALFDFDGVVMDTEKQYSLFWKKQGENYHPEIKDFELKIKGQTLDQIFGNYFDGNEEVQEAIREDINAFEKRMTYEFVPGITSFLEKLRARQVKTAVVTSSNRLKMENVYRFHPHIRTLFDTIIVAEDFTHSKPDPECYLLGAGKFGAEPENCFVFEDSFHGLESGRRAGMTVIALSTTNSYDALRDKSDHVIPDFTGFTFDEMMGIKSGR